MHFDNPLVFKNSLGKDCLGNYISSINASTLILYHITEYFILDKDVH
jgi:hypothetical protein